MKKLIISLLLVTTTNLNLWATVDLHSHLAAHIPYGFMLFGGTALDAPPKELPIYKHANSQQMYVDWMLKSGIKLFVDAALVNLFKFSKESSKAQVLEQFRWTEGFVNANPGSFAIANTPAEARTHIANGKIVFVRALEGAEFLVSTREDVKFWKQQGVAMIAPIHLVDNMYGDASIMPGLRQILNPLGVIRNLFTADSRVGLTQLGKKAISMILEEGMIVDMAHMSSNSTDQTIRLHGDYGLGPVMSHGYLKEVKNDPRGMTKKQVMDTYKLGGLIAITGGHGVLTPTDPNFAGKPSDYCKDTEDDYLVHYKKMKEYLGDQVPIGWGSDANGFVSHFRPRKGSDGCHDKQSKGSDFEHTGVRGLFDVPPLFLRMKMQGVDVSNIEKSHERFIEIWERAEAYANKQ